MGNYHRGHYHGNMPTWRTDGNRPEGPMIGIELELMHSDGYERVLDALPDTKPSRRPIAEMDGSLNDLTGVEIVFPPFKYSTIKHPNSWLATALAALREGGARPSRYTGMHLNINTNGWPENIRARFGAVINYLPPSVLSNLGGRMPNEYCGQTIYPFVSQYPSFVGASHHSCVSFRRNRLELRFPDATTDHSRLVVLTNFIEQVEKFVRSWPETTDDLPRYLGVPFVNIHSSATYFRLRTTMLEKFVQHLTAQRQTKGIRRLREVISNGHGS